MDELKEMEKKYKNLKSERERERERKGKEKEKETEWKMPHKMQCQEGPNQS